MALQQYEVAADLYSKDNKKSNAKDCNIKVATMCSSKGCAMLNDQNQQGAVGEFQRAAGIFEQVAKECLESKLGSFSAKGYFFQALLCVLAQGE